jgi:hypothetical protein
MALVIVLLASLAGGMQPAGEPVAATVPTHQHVLQEKKATAPVTGQSLSDDFVFYSTVIDLSNL